MQKAIYTVRIEDNDTEQILNEIDLFFIELGQRYTNVHVST